tara:strand:+ start:393 stop:605 length:213 start_codon:yes stop_codon:yes gene_type:complete
VSDELEVVGTIVRDAVMDCKIKRGKYWNIEVLDIRWFKNDKPTNKGVRLNMEEAKLLLDILRREINEESK